MTEFRFVFHTPRAPRKTQKSMWICTDVIVKAYRNGELDLRLCVPMGACGLVASVSSKKGLRSFCAVIVRRFVFVTVRCRDVRS